MQNALSPHVPRMRVLIVDDEPLAVEGLRLWVRADPELEHVGEARHGLEALAQLAGLQPDLMLLDVQMPELNGFDLLERIPRERMPMVIFVSAFDRYAIKAFDVHALDYLLKPVAEARFRESIDRFKAYFAARHTAQLNEHVNELVARRATAASGPVADADVRLEPMRRIAVKDSDRVRLIDVADIDWIEAADYYVALHVAGRMLLHRETMQRLDQRLDPRQFVRIHRSAIVNQARIRELRRNERRDTVVVLDDGTCIKVAPGYREKLGRLLEQL